ncbi:MAG: hypothetical protein IJ147_00195 [Lachnospiraceae bacterium]|nr:hypothetical protein [Lachnospiraceae bacterium]
MADIDFEKLYKDAQSTYEILQDESLWFGRGSSEYKAAKEQMEQDVKLWDGLVKKKKDDPNYVMSDYEIQLANQLLANQDRLIDSYLDNKEEEKKKLEAEGKKLSQTSEDRIAAMNRAKSTVNRQKNALDEALSERIEEQPAPSREDIKKESESILKDMNDAEKGVWFGSSEYEEAKESYKLLQSDWSEMDNRFKDKTPDPGDLQWMKSRILDAQEKTDAYLLKKGDEQTKEKPLKRMKAMGRSRDGMNNMLKKIQEWEKANQEKEIKYDPDKALEGVNKQLQDMQDANKGAFVGSSEYRAAMKAVEEQQKLWAKIQAKGKDYKPTPQEMNELERVNDKAEKAIDTYIFNHVKEGLQGNERRKHRMRTMMNAKNHVNSQKQILADRRKEFSAEAEKMTYAELGEKAVEAESDLRDARRNVHFGSRAFKNGMQKYARSYSKWSVMENKGAEYEPTMDEIKAMKAEMQDAQKAIDKYLDSKKDKDLEKNPKTKKRVDAMKQAHKNLELRLRKLEKIENKLSGVSREEEKKKLGERVKNLKNDAKNKSGYEKHAARASLAATQKLAKLSQRTDFTELELKEARRAAAALVLEERLKDMPAADKTSLKKTDAYAKAIKSIAESKEFKEALPNKKLTPLNCKHFAKNPESVKKLAKDFNDKLIKKQNAKKEKQKEKNKELQKENKKELKPEPKKS